MSDNASRFNAGKPKLSFCMEGKEALEGEARVWENGTKKYSRSNWTLGTPYTEAIDSLLRHVAKFLMGEDLDVNNKGEADAKHSGLPHVDHIVCCAKILSQSYHTRPDLDDRGVIQRVILEKTVVTLDDLATLIGVETDLDRAEAQEFEEYEADKKRAAFGSDTTKKRAEYASEADVLALIQSRDKRWAKSLAEAKTERISEDGTLARMFKDQ